MALVTSFAEVKQRHDEFLKLTSDPTTTPPSVFKPLSAKQLAELKIIREVSLTLQKKKEDEVNAPTAAEEGEDKVDDKKNEEEKKENSEDKPPPKDV